MAVSSVDAVKTGSRMPHSDSTHAHTNEARRRFPHNNNTRRRDGAGSSRGGGYAHNRRGHVAPKKQMLTLDECQHLFAGVPSRTHHGSVKMQGELTECDICCRESDLFAIGECSHPLCMECGIRLRILSKADTCPKCRAVLETMYFVPYAGDWSNFVMPKDFVEHADCERYKIKFANDYAVKCYDSYLAHVCIICEKKDVKREFPTFAALNQHVWMVHRFEFCEICAEHLNLLSRERRIYSRLDLERHLETGDPDDKSQKGHPLCLFCEKRFLDDEFRYKHLRKDHFFCQICDADGFSNYFFPEHKDLLRHYRKQHVICEEGECKQLGIAFRTDTELKLHKSRDHAAGRQTLNLDFHYTDRNLSGTSRGGRGGAQRGAPANRGNTIAQRNLPRVGVVPSEQPSAPARTPETVDVVIVPSAQNRPTAPSLRYSCAPVFRMEGNDFPRLGAAGPSSVRNQPRPQLGTSNQPVVTTPASACTTASTNPSAQPSAKPSWFIDDDEQFPSHRPHPALAAEHSDLQPQSEATANIDEVEVSQSSAPVVEGSWGGAMRRPNSLSSIASTLTANAFPSLGAPAKPLPKNLPPNSAWAKNKLSFPQGSSSSAIVGCMVPERNTAKKKPLPKPDIWPEEVVPSNWEERDVENSAEEEKLKPIGKKAKGNMGTEEKEENSARKKKNKKEKVKQQQQKQPANARVLETGSTDGKPATVGKRLQSNDKEPEATVTATESCGTLMTATAGSQKRSDNSEQQKAREKRKEAEPDQADPFPTLGGNTSDGKIESSEQPYATFATSFSQMLSSAFSSLIGGGSNCPPTETNTKQRDFGENEANEVEEFPSLGGNVQQGEAKSLPSAWTKGAPDLASDKGAQNAKKHPIKTLPVPDVWCDRSAELQMTEKGQASTVLPAGLGAPPGLGVQPGLAPPPGFGPPPGFEAPSVSGGSAVIKASGSSPSPSLNDKWVAVPKKGKK